MTLQRPMFPPRVESVDSFLPQTLHQLRPKEREMVAALLGFVACGLECGSTLEEMEAVAFDEMDRARQSAEKSRSQALRRSQLTTLRCNHEHGYQ
jgi:hypothetical protein